MDFLSLHIHLRSIRIFLRVAIINEYAFSVLTQLWLYFADIFVTRILFRKYLREKYR